ncbi:UDP-glucuronosyltransferase 2A2 isoform X2 [Microcaecilia unicolor]|uniref:UDP-glucuronosyltransferase n=1 Tax=Microcaecilia unicolor TaxID=1415580 RepID=A0A6P7X893_9AMPH|nr:UDP-glucuronosyltransferase 2A2-like isoform X2 [Microcaecilia unicolor]
MPLKLISALILLQVFFPVPSLCGKILVWPTDVSDWTNMKIILEELVHRGHNVTVLMHTGNIFIDFTTPSSFNFEVFQAAFGKVKMRAFLDDLLQFFIYELPYLSYWESYIKIKEVTVNISALQKQICDSVVLNKELMGKLQTMDFDLVLSDPLTLCGELLAEMLSIPFIYTIRFAEAHTFERLCSMLPAPSSYVPGPMMGLTDTMSFTQRLKNMLFYLSQDVHFYYYVWEQWNQYYTHVLGKPTTFCEIMGKAEIWLIRTYWDFEYPRPFLPNFEFVGGLHCQPAKPLPEDMEKFVQSSGEHGIVVFSLGSMVKNLSIEKANIIGTALSKIPQKVLWRYSGKTPETLGHNTKLYDWLPQNDLLGHPKTKAFIAHGGTNGIYEAIYHGIPMVGIPLFADQPDNMAHMKAKGMAVVLNYNTFEAQDLVDALNTVINNPIYKENAMKLSQIQHDQPIKPLDRAVFWIEFVMRHKGAKHLRPASHHLTWYQYHCLDVIAFLILCLAVFLIVSIKCCSFCFGKRKRVVKKKRE